MIPGTIVSALSLALLPLAHEFPHFLISGALFGLGFGTAQPAALAMLVDRVRLEQRGLAMSTYFLGFDLGISLGSMGLGVVGQNWGFGVMWPISAVCVLLGLLGLRGAKRPTQQAGDNAILKPAAQEWFGGDADE
jgi:MFS family permease